MLRSSIPREMGMSRWFIYNELLRLDLEHPLALHWYKGRGKLCTRCSGYQDVGLAPALLPPHPAHSRHALDIQV